MKSDFQKKGNGSLRGSISSSQDSFRGGKGKKYKKNNNLSFNSDF